MILIRTWVELDGAHFAMPLHKDYPNMYGVGLSAKIARKRVLDKIEIKSKMDEIDKLKVELAWIKGQYIGTLKGILWWDIPSKLKENLKKQIKELEEEKK